MNKYILGLIFYVTAFGAYSKNVELNSPIPTTQVNTNKQSFPNLISSGNYLPIGETTFSILFWDLYKSKLFTTSGSYPISLKSESLIFHINYLVDISSEDLINRTVEQWKLLGVKKIKYEGYIEQLKELWPDIKEGDSLAVLVEQHKSDFYFNDEYLGSIHDPSFGQLFIDIWLSKDTSQPSLRAELLGDNDYE